MKHRVAKLYGDNICYTRNMELAILRDVISHNLVDLAQCIFDTAAVLIHAAPPSPAIRRFLSESMGFDLQVGDCFVARKARIIPAGYVCVGDVCIAQSHRAGEFIAGEVMLNMDVLQRPMCLLNVYTAGAYDRNNGVCEWVTGDTHKFVELSDIWSAVSFVATGGDSIRALIPWLFRKYTPCVG